MGTILSRVRKIKSTVEILEKLENDIKELEENRSDAQRKYKQFTKLFLIYSTGLYILCGIFFYFYSSFSNKEKLLYLVPLAFSPLLLYIVKRIISWYYIRLINNNQKILNEMKKEKKKLLDEVMEKETYKVAKEILEKYSTETLPKPGYSMMRAPINPQSDDALRKRLNAPKAQPPSQRHSNLTAYQPPRPISHMPNEPLQGPGRPNLWMPAPILPLNRSYMDKFMEYLIGDGPNNRYALICSKCHSHNGMALKEEFEYIGYKCCYCFEYNPARKIKPEAPRLESPQRAVMGPDSDSDSKMSAESSDTETEAILNSEESPLAISNAEASNIRHDSTSTESGAPRGTEVDVKAADSTAVGDVPAETTEENTVEEFPSSNQPDDASCDQSLLKS